MKKIIALPIIASISLLFGACHKKSAERTTSTHYLSFTSGTVGSFYSSGSMTSAAGASGLKIAIDATSSAGAQLTLYLNPYIATPGVFLISGPNVGGVYYSATHDTVISSVHGNITLTSVTPDIIGTFYYTGTDSSIFSGSFDVLAP